MPKSTMIRNRGHEVEKENAIKGTLMTRPLNSSNISHFLLGREARMRKIKRGINAPPRCPATKR